jgi:hypothetical protein
MVAKKKKPNSKRKEVTPTNVNEWNGPACPYCLTPNFFQDVLALPVGASADGGVGQRTGSIWRRMPTLGQDMVWRGMAGRIERRDAEDGRFFFVTYYTDKDFIDRLKGFSVILIGHEVEGNFRPYFEPGPFFFSGLHNDQTQRRWIHYLHYAARVSHKNSAVTIDIHWWPSHDRIVTTRSIPSGGASANDMKFITETFKLLRAETRGGGQKIEEVELIEAVQKFGKEATQVKVAKELGVSTVTLKRWTAQKRKRWHELKSEYLQTELI